MAEQYQLPKMKKDMAQLEKELQAAHDENTRLRNNMDELAAMTPESQMQKALSAAGLDQGKQKKDFDLFIEGLKNLPGDDIHMVVDGTGSMHGVASFLIPVLRVIVIRTEKKLSAVTWFADGTLKTYQGSMGEMFDSLMSGAPFVGDRETLGQAFRHISEESPAPGAYIVIGDEPSDDTIAFLSIPSPVFTLPIGKENPDTIWEYQRLADKTGGRMLRLIFK